MCDNRIFFFFFVSTLWPTRLWGETWDDLEETEEMRRNVLHVVEKAFFESHDDGRDAR